MAALPARRSGTPGLRSQKLLQIFKRPGILGKRIPLWFLSCLFRLAHCSWYVASVERMIFAMPVRSVPDAKSPQGACVCVLRFSVGCSFLLSQSDRSDACIQMTLADGLKSRTKRPNNSVRSWRRELGLKSMCFCMPTCICWNRLQRLGPKSRALVGVKIRHGFPQFHKG